MAVLHVNVNTVCNATCNFSSYLIINRITEFLSRVRSHSKSSVCSKHNMCGILCTHLLSLRNACTSSEWLMRLRRPVVSRPHNENSFYKGLRGRSRQQVLGKCGIAGRPLRTGIQPTDIANLSSVSEAMLQLLNFSVRTA